MAKKVSKAETQMILRIVIEAIQEVKGQEIISMDLTQIKDTITDYFVIAHGDSSTQVNAMHHSILKMAKEAGLKPYHSEGQKNGEWIIVDFVDVVVHLFYRETRNFYQLEELWSDAKIVKHDIEETIKTKAVRQTKKATAPKKVVAPKKATVKKAAAKKK